jgi:hypothetical protein
MSRVAEDFLMRDFKLLPRYIWDLCFSGIWRNEAWKLLTDVSGQTIGPIFKGQEINFLNLQHGNDSISWNLGKKLSLRAK